MLYSQNAWDQLDPPVARTLSRYSGEYSESASEYSKRECESPRSSFDGGQHYNTRIHGSTTIIDPPTTITPDRDEQDEDDLGNGANLTTRLSIMGPKTRLISRAPWEDGGEEDIEEVDEDDHSLFGGRSRSKKPKESTPSTRSFNLPFAPRASSSSRPSVDISTTSIHSPSSPGPRFRPSALQFRRTSSATTGSGASEAIPFPSPRYERVLESPRSITLDAPHPYANPSNSPVPANTKIGRSSRSNSSSLAASPLPFNYSREPSPRLPQTPDRGEELSNVIPTKMAPWQHTPSSPTFHLVSLEEAQALKAARQRQLSEGSRIPTVGRSATGVSDTFKSESPLQTSDEAGPTKTLKGRRSLLGLFSKGKEKERSVTPRSSSPPPPMPDIPYIANRTEVPTHIMMGSSSTTETTPSKSQRRIPPPSLNVVVTSPQVGIKSSPTRETPHTSHSVAGHVAPKRKASASTLSASKEKKALNSTLAASGSQGFVALSVRPVSTMFHSMPQDYLASPTSPPLPTGRPALLSSSSSTFSTQSPTTPSLCSRSTSMSTGSSDNAGPLTPSGYSHMPLNSAPLDAVDKKTLVQLQGQIQGAAETWRTQISDLEAQVIALKAELDAIRRIPCPSCGHVGVHPGEPGGKSSIVNRPRARTGVNRTMFGQGD